MKYKFLITTISFILLISEKALSQEDSAALAAADTTNFSVNSSDNWSLFNSYIAYYNTDSVQLEIIVQHSNNFDWSLEQYVGKIKSIDYLPGAGQTLLFNLIDNNYSLRIDTDGKCFLKLFSGAAPPADPIVIPVKVLYKK